MTISAEGAVPSNVTIYGARTHVTEAGSLIFSYYASGSQLTQLWCHCTFEGTAPAVLNLADSLVSSDEEPLRLVSGL